MTRQTTRRLELKVKGMTCGGCVRSVQKVLSSVSGIMEFDVRVGVVTVLIDTQRLNAETVVAALRAAGYGAELNGQPSAEGPQI